MRKNHVPTSRKKYTQRAVLAPYAANKHSEETQEQPKRKGLRLHNAVRRNPYFGNLGDYTAPMPLSLTLDQVKAAYGIPQTLSSNPDVKMAFDSQMELAGGFSLIQHSLQMGMLGGSSNFMGYAALQNIAQNGLIRACVETIADDMTRNWIELKRQAEKADGETSDETEQNPDEEDILDRLKKEMKRLNLQGVFHDAVADCGYYGGCLVYIDTGLTGEDLAAPMYLDPLYSSEANRKGFLRGVRVIDPINISPGLCNFTDPLAPDYYKPSTWNILGRIVHSTRLLRIVANEAPLVLKPAYNFLGIPQAQILWDYVMHFQKNRDNTNRLLGKFSSTVLKTNMADILGGDSDDLSELDARVKLYVSTRSNDGVLVIDKESEDILKLETPMSGLTDIVRQSLEILAAMNRTPAVKLLGISPSGFNATGESDIRNYYDYILSQQEKQLRPAIEEVLRVMQLSLTGTIDPSITFDFCPLSEEDKAAKAATQGTKVGTLVSLIDSGVISAEEAREVLISDPDSGLNDLDPDDIPEPQGEEGGMEGMMGGLFGGGTQNEQADAETKQQELFGEKDGDTL